jgi:hypothetical protein
MHYVISDSEGNTLDTFRDERAAERVLLVMVAERPEDENELLLLAYDDEGEPAGPARLATDVRCGSALAAIERCRSSLWYTMATCSSPRTVGSAIFGAMTTTSSTSGANTDGRVTSLA